MNDPARLLEIISAPDATTVIDPPGDGEGSRAGGPSAGWQDGAVCLAYRLRRR